MNSSLVITEIAAALVKAQSEFSPAVRSSINPHFKSKYVDLATAIEAAQPALLKNGIAVLQGVSGDIPTSSISVTTRLLHTSGEWIEDTLTLPAANRGNFDAQSVGSATTYGRRYAYMAMLGFAAEDDDGNAGSARQQVQPRSEFKQQLRQSVNPDAEPPTDDAPPFDASFLDDPAPRPQDRTPRVDEAIGDKANVLYAIAMKAGMQVDTYRNFINKQGFSKDRDIPKSRFNEIKDRLEASLS